MTTVITNTTTPSHDTDFSSKIVFGLAYVLPCRPAAFKHDDQQLRHRHRYALRYGHDSLCPPSIDHSTKTTALFLTETAKQNFKRHLKREDKSKFCVFDNSKSD